MSSGELVHVPEAAKDPGLTPTQRFEMIARTARGMEQYNAPRETGESTTREQHQQLVVIEHARYVGRCRDKNGLVTSEQFVNSTAHVAFDYGYPIPAGMRYDPQELTDMLSVAHAVDPTHAHGQFVYAVLVELGKRLK